MLISPLRVKMLLPIVKPADCCSPVQFEKLALKSRHSGIRPMK